MSFRLWWKIATNNDTDPILLYYFIYIKTTTLYIVLYTYTSKAMATDFSIILL